MDTAHLVVSKDLDVFIGEEQAVSCDYVRAEDAQGIKILSGGEALVEPAAVLVFLGCLCKVHVDPEAAVTGEIRRPQDVLLSYRVDGVDGDCENGLLAPVQGLFIEFLAGDALHCGHLGVLGIQEDERYSRPQAHFHGGLAGVGREPVLVIESGGAALYHLKAGSLGAPVDELSVHLGLRCPHFIQPLVKGEVLVDAAQHNHCRVGVGVYESGDYSLAAAVNDFF